MLHVFFIHTWTLNMKSPYPGNKKVKKKTFDMIVYLFCIGILLTLSTLLEAASQDTRHFNKEIIKEEFYKAVKWTDKSENKSDSVIDRVLRENSVHLDYTHKDSIGVKSAKSAVEHISKDLTLSIIRYNLDISSYTSIELGDTVTKICALLYEYRSFSFTVSERLSNLFLEFLLKFGQVNCWKYNLAVEYLTKSIPKHTIVNIFDRCVKYYNVNSRIIPLFSIDTVGMDLEYKIMYQDQILLLYEKVKDFSHATSVMCFSIFEIMMKLPDISSITDTISDCVTRINFDCHLTTPSSSLSLSKFIKLCDEVSSAIILTYITRLALSETSIKSLKKHRFAAYGSILEALEESNEIEYLEYLDNFGEEFQIKVKTIFTEFEKYKNVYEKANICKQFSKIFASKDPDIINGLNESLIFLTGDNYTYLIESDNDFAVSVTEIIMEIFIDIPVADTSFGLEKLQVLTSAVQYCFINVKPYRTFYNMVINVIHFFHYIFSDDDDCSSKQPIISENRAAFEDCLIKIHFNFLQLIHERLFPEHYGNFMAILRFYRAVLESPLDKIYSLMSALLRRYLSASLLREFIDFSIENNIFSPSHFAACFLTQLQDSKRCDMFISQAFAILKNERVFSKTELQVLEKLIQ